ncbi:adenylate/guanylate cyclase domain-containing protein [Roseibium aggregatum]|uniref:PAS domain S-box protein n=1 Tax=Roseibium aggregatum TaxID=187304 RepID=A0A926S8U7_9HYPH|nr:adenylate/guanylate cyclase domain-containing protein [Roseibium aggregatum]MBD1549352.1 PAS domain S-box protein [Roseibium aggregatum]
MLLDHVQLQQVCDQISMEINAIVSIFAERGEIICSSQRSRIGFLHTGVAKILTGEVNHYEASAEDAALHPDILEGVALPIEIDGKRLLCVSVCAPVEIACTYCRLVQHWVVALLREQALFESEARFRDVAESAGDWIWEMGADLRFTYLSPRFYEAFRVQPEAIIGKTRTEWAASDTDSQDFRDHQAKLLARLPFRDFSYRIRNGDGEIRNVCASGKPIFDAQGEFAGYRGTGYDFTEQLEMENALRRTQQLLADSIETIPEAFALFDREDRLVIFNSKYHSLLFGDIGVEIAPGMTFETIIRNGAQTGRIPEAEGRREEWIKERLARHRELSEPHIQQRDEGRWILVSEHRTTDGGTVAIYSDISEIKRRELELAEKSRDMERLSNQFAKYLSPQIYESIFSGRQEVKLASRRRKLTVFFSDIVGFTEMADRLESEEVTQLLNHYLSEMSDIALKHGATIDKYVGDAIVIFFGDPESRGVKQDALQCARMATSMQRRMADLREMWRDTGIDYPLECRMGISTGFCTVGNFGSENRMEYTIIGSGVNLASRLETAARPGEILIPYETYALIKDEFDCEERGQIEVRGIGHPVSTYSIVVEKAPNDPKPAPPDANSQNFALYFNVDQMSPEERAAADKALRHALSLLSAGATEVS